MTKESGYIFEEQILRSFNGSNSCNFKEPVSYTHLDVYKRQLFFSVGGCVCVGAGLFVGFSVGFSVAF